MVKRWIVLLFLGVFLISLVSASQFAYNYLDNQVTTSSINYSLVNVNNSQYLGGLPASSYIPYVSADKNINLGANNFTIDTDTLFVDSTRNKVGIGTLSPSSALQVMGRITTNTTELNSASGIDVFTLKSGTQVYYRYVMYADDGVHIAISDDGGATNRNYIFTSYANRAKDHDHEDLSANPTIFIHSATNPDTNNTQWLSLTHDQTNGVINTGSGYLRVSSDSGDISIYADKNITATGFITRTSVFDKSDGSPFNYIKDSSYYLDSKNKIKHKNFYGYVNNIIATDYSKPVVTYYYEDGIKKELITYPYTKMEEGVELGSEVDVLRQAVYELNERVKYLEENCILK